MAVAAPLRQALGELHELAEAAAAGDLGGDHGLKQIWYHPRGQSALMWDLESLEMQSASSAAADSIALAVSTPGIYPLGSDGGGDNDAAIEEALQGFRPDPTNPEVGTPGILSQRPVRRIKNYELIPKHHLWTLMIWLSSGWAVCVPRAQGFTFRELGVTYNFVPPRRFGDPSLFLVGWCRLTPA